MSHELVYTSAPQGLKPGSKGFCTVAATHGITPALAQLLEALSGYRISFPPGHGIADRNPVAFSHLRYDDAGRRCSILSRTCAAGLDYSGRGNTFSHHVILNDAELPEGGPAWSLRQPGFVEKAWDGHVRYIDVGRPPPYGDDDPPRPCRRWQDLTGDAAWGGIVAETCLSPRRQLVYLVFEPGMDLLPLLAESLALLPADRRWGVTFSTFYTGMPYGLECQVRGILAGSPEHAKARREAGALVIDLTEHAISADRSPWAEAGRTGHPPGLAGEAMSPRWERAPTPPTPVAALPEPVNVWKKAVAEARLSAPTPMRPFPAPPLEPLPSPMAVRAPIPQTRTGGNLFLPWCIGLFLGLTLGAVGMYFGLQMKESVTKSPDPTANDLKKPDPKRAEPEDAHSLLPPADPALLALVFSAAVDKLESRLKDLKREKTQIEGDLANARKEKNTLEHDKAKLEREKTRLQKEKDKLQTQVDDHGRQEDGERERTRWRTVSLTEPIEAEDETKPTNRAFYYTLEGPFDPKQQYRFALPMGYRLRQKGVPQMYFWHDDKYFAAFTVPRSDSKKEPLVGIWTYAEGVEEGKPNILSFQALGPEKWSPQDIRHMGEAMTSWTHLVEKQSTTCLLVMRPFQPLGVFRLTAQNRALPAEMLTHVHAWEKNRLLLRAGTINLLPAELFHVKETNGAGPLARNFVVADQNNATFATVYVQVKVDEKSGLCKLELSLELDATYIRKLPDRDLYGKLVRLLEVVVGDITVVMDAGGNPECVLARTVADKNPMEPKPKRPPMRRQGQGVGRVPLM